MIKIFGTRLKQGHRTLPFPPKPLPERFNGCPVVDQHHCKGDCSLCRDVCPVGAVSTAPLTLDMGKCVLCRACEKVCPEYAIKFSGSVAMSASKRDDLKISSLNSPEVAALPEKIRRIFGRSLKLRVVTAGSCAGCEMELNALSNIEFDVSRFGVQIVASPRHADGLIVTGAVSKNMETALKKSYEALSDPKIVIATGACAISGGPFCGGKEVKNGAESVLPVDLFIAGCPPHPMTLIDGLTRLLGQKFKV